jgi:hypothetical protein
MAPALSTAVLSCMVLLLPLSKPAVDIHVVSHRLSLYSCSCKPSQTPAALICSRPQWMPVTVQLRCSFKSQRPSLYETTECVLTHVTCEVEKQRPQINPDLNYFRNSYVFFQKKS